MHTSPTVALKSLATSPTPVSPYLIGGVIIAASILIIILIVFAGFFLCRYRRRKSSRGVGSLDLNASEAGDGPGGNVNDRTPLTPRGFAAGATGSGWGRGGRASTPYVLSYVPPGRHLGIGPSAGGSGNDATSGMYSPRNGNGNGLSSPGIHSAGIHSAGTDGSLATASRLQIPSSPPVLVSIPPRVNGKRAEVERERERTRAMLMASRRLSRHEDAGFAIPQPGDPAGRGGGDGGREVAPISSGSRSSTITSILFAPPEPEMQMTQAAGPPTSFRVPSFKFTSPAPSIMSTVPETENRKGKGKEREVHQEGPPPTGRRSQRLRPLSLLVAREQGKVIVNV